MKKIFIVLILLPIYSFTQNDSVYNLNKDIISINEDGIDELVYKYEQILKNRNGVKGWRIQLKFKAKESEIIQLKLKFIKLFPEIPVLLEYQEPYYRIRVGNCRTKLEALKIKNEIKKEFPGSYPVPEIINFLELKD
tara:strand:+ start:30 stop:440 length:411 start_codon:yes stop_codon:yes gene_type:complete